MTWKKALKSIYWLLKPQADNSSLPGLRMEFPSRIPCPGFSIKLIDENGKSLENTAGLRIVTMSGKTISIGLEGFVTRKIVDELEKDPPCIIRVESLYHGIKK